MSRSYVALVLSIAFLATLAAAAAGGWHARAVIAERDALAELAQETERARVAQRLANAASVRYIDARDALAPAVHLVRVAAAPVVRVLDSCPLPFNARGMLDNAAALADCRSADCPSVPASTAPASF